MFRLQAYQIAKIEHEVRVPLTGTRSYLVTVSQGATFVKPAFSNGAKLDCSPIDWCHNMVPKASLDHAPTETDDEFLSSLPENDDAFMQKVREDRGLSSVSNIAREEEAGPTDTLAPERPA